MMTRHSCFYISSL